MKYIISFLCIFSLSTLPAAENISFSSVQQIFDYAAKNSAILKTGNEQLLIAKWTKIAAIGNTLNLRNPVAFSMTDNTKLPVSFIPAETFGGKAGEFKQITLGQQYISNLNFAPTIDIINPNAWARIKSAKLNDQLTQVNTLLVKKSLYESIAAAYFNVVSLQQQLKLLEITKQNSDSITAVVSRKYAEGIVRKTDENEALIAKESIAERYNQTQLQAAQQLNILKTLCDIPLETAVTVENVENIPVLENKISAENNLQKRQYELQYLYAKSEYNATKLNHLPTVSFFTSFSWQQNSNSAFFDKNNTWINSNFIGLRLNVNLPSDINKIANQATSKFNTRIAKYNFEHYEKLNNINNQQLVLDYQKALSQYQSIQKIQILKDENYTKFLNLYKANLLSIDRLLNAHNDKVSNQLSLTNALSQLNHYATQISINNSIK